MKKIVLIVVAMILIMSMLAGCYSEQADNVSYNLSKEADNFNVVRQITVINLFTNDVLFQMTGRLSLETDSIDGKIDVIVETAEGEYKKHFIGLGDNVAYVIEQIDGSSVDRYAYTINYNPKMWKPVDFDYID